jgi:hypothetical protein
MEGVDRKQAVLLPAADKESRSFLKKRTKRLLFFRSFNLFGQCPNLRPGAESKVFWFFSSEKNMPYTSKRCRPPAP